MTRGNNPVYFFTLSSACAPCYDSIEGKYGVILSSLLTVIRKDDTVKKKENP